MNVELSPQQISKLLNKPLSLDCFFYLIYRQNNIEFPSENVQAIEFNLLKDGLMYVGGKVTAKGNSFIEEVMGVVSSKVDNKVDYESLHRKLKQKLHTLTGKYQKMVQGKYAFLCNSIDMESKLSKVIKKYKLTDFNRIEVLLLRHVDKAWTAKFDKVSLIEYYIEKSGVSQLATDYSNFEEVEDVKSVGQSQKFM